MTTTIQNISADLMVDPQLLHIIFLNLLSNACKYTPNEKSIFISLEQLNKRIVFSVEDEGCGIPKEQQKFIFTKLFRAENAKRIDTKGTGLGLYIVKSIADASGCNVSFTSKEKIGSTFTYTCPARGMKAKKKNGGQSL